MQQIEREIEQLFLDRCLWGDYAIPEELEHWTASDFDDVLMSYQPIAADEY